MPKHKKNNPRALKKYRISWIIVYGGVKCILKIGKLLGPKILYRMVKYRICRNHIKKKHPDNKIGEKLCLSISNKQKIGLVQRFRHQT